MARTTEEIYQAMLVEKTAYPELDVLDSPSNTAIWRLMLRVVAYAINALEQLFDLFKVEVAAIVAGAPFMTDTWLAAQSLLFQDGDDLLVSESYQLYYEVIDLEKRIVAVASARTDSFGQCLLKVAKGEVGAYQALEVEELTRFRAYINDIKPVGTAISTVSLDADLLKGTFNIYYDASYILTDLEVRVVDAIAQFLALQPFNGLLYLSRLVDAIQAVQGVTDVLLEDVEGRAALGSYAPIERRYQPESGYMELDNFDSTFNYVAE